jgi:hypothetical protein
VVVAVVVAVVMVVAVAMVVMVARGVGGSCMWRGGGGGDVWGWRDVGVQGCGGDRGGSGKRCRWGVVEVCGSSWKTIKRLPER